jgi:RHS repeat-associated protein
MSSHRLVFLSLWQDGGDPGQFPEPVAMVDYTSSGVRGTGVAEVFHFLHDALGSVIGLMADAEPGDPGATPPIPALPAGRLVERYTYDPYGRTYIEHPDGESGWVANLCPGTGNLCYSAYGNPFMWTGQRYDAATGLYAFLFRRYSPELGRWLQRDPAGYVDGVNLYQYVASNPLASTDPLGLVPPSMIPDAAYCWEKQRQLREGRLSTDEYVTKVSRYFVWSGVCQPVGTGVGSLVGANATNTAGGRRYGCAGRGGNVTFSEISSSVSVGSEIVPHFSNRWIACLFSAATSRSTPSRATMRCSS